MTIAEAAKISNGGPGGNRGLSFQKCVDAAAAAGTTVPAGNMTMVVTTPEVDLWGGGGGRAFMAVDKEIAAFAHEVSHGIGLEHSHSTNVSGPCGGGPDEYHDPFDVMSWACTTRGTQTPRFGSGGPAFNAFQMDRMGWLGRSEILVFGAGGTTSNTITVTALYKPGAGGTRLVRIPFDASDLNRYFTVELRMPLNWDAGIGPPIVVLHESRWDPVHSQFRSYLIRGSLDGPAAQTLNANGVTINVQSIDPASQTAQVQITSQLATQCVLGFVWREAGPGDHVCVTGLAREAARAENQLADSRRSPNGGPSGPNTCKQGFVWREAFPGDQVCVPGTARSRVRGENTVGPSVVNPARFAFGPNTCKLGFVHREGDDKDWVCVSGTTRTETRTENSLGPSRTVAGSDACKQGFVWREAFPGDKTCVPGTSRTRARTDNAAADSRRIAF